MAENVETEAPDLVAVQVERPTLVVKRNDRGFDRSRPQIILYNHRPGPRFSSTEFVRREDIVLRLTDGCRLRLYFPVETPPV